MTLSGRTYPMDGPPAALDFTPNVADGVADAAENAACAEPAPNLSPACATRGAGAVGYAARLQRGYGVVTWPRRWKPLSAQHAARSAPDFFLWARCCKLAKAADAAVSSACGQGSPVREMLLASVEFTGETSCGRGHARRQVRLISGRENLFATPPEEKKEIQSKTTIGRAVYKTRGSSPLPVLL